MADLDSSSTPAPNSTPGQQAQLSPGVSYYLRRFLRRNLDRLTDTDGHSISTTVLNDLEALLQSSGEPSLRTAIRDLEELTQQHQTFSNQGLKSRQALRSTEAQIFLKLGLVLKQEQQQATILIVDDTPDNLRVLSTTLSQHGYAARSAINGALALSSAQMIKPDLILLDIMMPGLSGYEVCERLKADPKTSDIPVIFISAIDDALDKVKAFSVGGVDYITKPFQIEEVLVRIEHQLKIWNLQKRLEEQGIRLQQEIAERQRVDNRTWQLFEKAVNGVYRIAPDGNFISANQALIELYGYASLPELITSVTAQTLYVNARRHTELISRLQIEDIVSGFESAVYRQDRQQLWISETVRAVRDELDNLLYYEGTVIDISVRKEAEEGWRRGRRRTRQLLVTIFPKTIAQQFSTQKEGNLLTHRCEQVTVLFVDIVGLNQLALDLTPANFTDVVNEILTEFDQVAEQHGVERMKLSSDRYMATAGVPMPNPAHAVAVVDLALDLNQLITHLQKAHQHRLQLRMGINSGSVLAGITGGRKMSYELWGDTVTIAHWLTDESEANKIQISGSTYQLLSGSYRVEMRRGGLTFKDGITRETYWLLGK